MLFLPAKSRLFFYWQQDYEYQFLYAQYYNRRKQLIFVLSFLARSKNQKFIQPYIFISLPYLSACARRKICIYQSNIAKVSPDNPSLKITLFNIAAFNNIIRFYFTKICLHRYILFFVHKTNVY